MVTDKITIIREADDPDGSLRGNVLKYWCNSTGDLHRQGDFNITEEDLPAPLRYLLMFFPLAALVRLLISCPDFTSLFFQRSDLPLWLLIYGCLGQVTFTCRFVYQWYCSRRCHESVLPLGFWMISLAGSTIIITYGLLRLDPVLIVGQAFGLVTYIRNIIIWKHQNTA